MTRIGLDRIGQTSAPPDLSRGLYLRAAPHPYSTRAVSGCRHMAVCRSQAGLVATVSALHSFRMYRRSEQILESQHRSTKQARWGEDWGTITGEQIKLQAAHTKLTHSQAFVILAYRRQTHEIMLDALSNALRKLGGVPHPGQRRRRGCRP